MASNEKISVIIINYNGGPLLTDCVRSVLRSKANFEILVGDNGSIDGSDFLLEKTFAHDNRLQIIRNNANLGFSKANNLLLEKADGAYFLCLNPDCIIKEDTLSLMLEHMKSHEDVGMASCLIRNPDGSEQAGSRRHIPTPWRSFVSVFGLSKIIKKHPRFSHIAMNNEPLPEEPIFVEAISGAFMFVRRIALEKVGGMDENYFIHCEDLDWCMQFRQSGWKILFVPDVEIMHVKGVPTASHPFRVEYHKHRGMIYFYNKFFRQQYPGILMWMVVCSVWLRFLLRSLKLWFSSLKRPETIWRWQDNANLPHKIASEDLNSAISPQKTVLVTGATSQIGHFLLPLLSKNGYHIHALSRSADTEKNSTGKNITWHQGDIRDSNNLPDIQASALIHLAPLDALPPLLPLFVQQGIQRVIAFGTTSRFTKTDSKNKNEQQLSRDFEAAENLLAEKSKELGVSWTLFRPTMIYGCGMDKNISTIYAFIKRFGFFLVAGKASGLRQPVHANDLALACLQALDAPASRNKAYNLSGGKTISYIAMVETIFQAMEKDPRVFRIPLFLYKSFLFCLSLLPGYNYITSEMADRMNQDLCFDHQQATDDFGYQPRPFDTTQVGNIH